VTLADVAVSVGLNTTSLRRYVDLLADIAEQRHVELISFQDFRALMRGSPSVVWPRTDENARAYLILSVTADAQAWPGG
jgi:hypothetical protein